MSPADSVPADFQSPADSPPSAPEGIRYQDHAGTVLWPSGPSALVDTTACPACFTALTASTCRKCGLDLTHPAAYELARLSKAASDTMANRIEVIGRIRYDTAHPVVATEVPTPPAPAPAAPAVTTVAPPNAPPPAPPHPPTSGKPRRSGVQVALLITAVSLLSIFAIFFLVYAFINYGLVWRSIIIASITIAAFVSATMLRRKGLTASAEGLAVFALLLIYLDAFALRTNDFFGLGSVDSAVYWGSTIAIASVGFIAWHRLSSMRSASIVGWTGLAIGTGTLAWGLADGVEPSTQAFIGLGATIVTGFSHVLISRPSFAGIIERMIVLATIALSLVIAFLVSWAVEPDKDWAGAIACAVVAILALVHSVIAAGRSDGTRAVQVFGHVFATVGGVAAAAAASVIAVRVASGDTGFATFLPAVGSVIIVLLLEVASHNPARPRLLPTAKFAAWGAFVVFALTALVPLADAIAPVGSGLARAIDQPLAESTGRGLASGHATSDLAVLALACVVALATAVWLLTGALRRRATVIAWGTSVVLVLAAAQLPSVWMSLTAWFLLTVIAFVVLLRRRDLSSASHACLVAVLSVSTALMLVIGWGSIDTWAPTTVAAILVVVGSRALTRTEPPRAAMLGGATLLLFAGAAAASHHLTWVQAPPRDLAVVNAAVLLTLVGAVVLAAASLTYGKAVTALDRRTVFWIAGAATGVAALMAANAVSNGVAINRASLFLPQPITNLIASVLLFAALLLWVARRGNSALRSERIVASVAIAPVVLWVVDSFASVLGLSAFAHSVVPITAALLTAAGALAFALLRPTGTPRWAREAGVALVGLPATVVAVGDNSDSGWLVLILAAVTVLLLSVSTDGLFSSTSLRRHLGWLALALATAGLWWRLSSNSVETLEPYVLPLAAALLVVAAFIHRAAARAEAPSPSRAASAIALGGLLVGVLPLAANSISGEPARAIIMFTVSAALLLAGSLASSIRLQPYLDAMSIAGVSGVLAAGLGRAVTMPDHNLVPDAWILAAFLVLLAAAFGQARQRGDASNPDARWRAVASQTLAVLAILAVGMEVAGFSDATLGTPRAIATVALLGTLHVIAFSLDSAPFTRRVGIIAISLAAGVAAFGVATNALDPIELGSVPIAVALLVSGGIVLTSQSHARSWRTLGVGVIVLLVPSLLATVTEPELWRLVGLGVASVTVLIVGAVRRLQAPFLLGLAVTLVHGFATFAPQIRAVYESQEWWLWAGLAGIVLLLLAIRYEKRIQNLKDAVGKIAALR